VRRDNAMRFERIGDARGLVDGLGVLLVRVLARIFLARALEARASAAGWSPSGGPPSFSESGSDIRVVCPNAFFRLPVIGGSRLGLGILPWYGRATPSC